MSNAAIPYRIAFSTHASLRSHDRLDVDMDNDESPVVKGS
jgi:hypothetical protein